MRSENILKTSLLIREKSETFLRWGFFSCLVLLLLAKGGTSWPTTEVIMIALAFVLTCTSLIPDRNQSVQKLRSISGFFIIAIIAYILFQALPIGLNPNPAWQLLEGRLPVPVYETISVAPGQTFWSLPKLLAPYIIFVAALGLYQFETVIDDLWNAMVWLGTAFSIYGILQLLLFPDWLFFSEKEHYRDALTGTLVNKNNTATLIGLFVIITLCSLRWELRRDNPANAEKPWMIVGHMALHSKVAQKLFFLSIQLLALGLTVSRGGLLALMAGGVVALKLLNFKFLKNRFGNKTLVWLMVILLVVIGLQLFAGRIFYRLETEENSGRLCTLISTYEAAKVNMPFGTGLGTFPDVFPAYRDQRCSIMGIWERAHNSYLENFLELGVPYFAFLFAGFLAIALVLRTGLKKRRSRRPFVVGGIAATVLVAVHSLADFSMQVPAIAGIYALILATSMTTSLTR